VDKISYYREIFRDVVNGYSEVELDGNTFFVKHLSVLDQVDIDKIQRRFYESAIKRGIPTESEVLSALNKDNIWTEKDEKEIDRLENFIESLIKNKSQIVLKSKLDEQNKSIEQTRKKINELQNKRNELIGVCAETYAAKRSNDHYVIKSFYNDRELKSAVFPDEKEFDELYSEDIAKFIQVYNNTFEMFEELKIQEMILQDFYYIYFPFSDDTVGFFGNPVCHLTYNQLKLIVYTKIFKGIFEQNQNIPDNIKKDPQALLDYGSVSEEAKQKVRDQIEKGQDGATLFNATDEDYEYAGLKKPSDTVKNSLHQAALKKGGSLSMQDLMELSGHK
jgi:predicted transcriptional regulator